MNLTSLNLNLLLKTFFLKILIFINFFSILNKNFSLKNKYKNTYRNLNFIRGTGIRADVAAKVG